MLFFLQYEQFLFLFLPQIHQKMHPVYKTRIFSQNFFPKQSEKLIFLSLQKETCNISRFTYPRTNCTAEGTKFEIQITSIRNHILLLFRYPKLVYAMFLLTMMNDVVYSPKSFLFFLLYTYIFKVKCTLKVSFKKNMGIKFNVHI